MGRATWVGLLSCLLALAPLGGLGAETPPSRPVQVFTPLKSDAPAGNAAILVGINRFQDVGNLSFAVHDAIELAFLVVFELKLIPPAECHLMLSGEPTADAVKQHLGQLRQAGVPITGATRTEIITTFSDVCSRPRERSNLLICSFSTHGFEQDGDAYVMPSDGRRNELAETAVSLKFIQRKLEGTQAQQDLFTLAGHRLLLVDACQERVSSERAVTTAGKPASNAFAAALGKGSGQATLAACSPGEMSVEHASLGGVGHGLFTFKLLEALRGGAAADAENIVKLDAVSDYVSKEVTSWTEQRQIAPQRPFLIGPVQAKSLPLAQRGDDLATLIAALARQPLGEGWTGELREALTQKLAKLDATDGGDRKLVSMSRDFVNSRIGSDLFALFLERDRARWNRAAGGISPPNSTSEPKSSPSPWLLEIAKANRSKPSLGAMVRPISAIQMRAAGLPERIGATVMNVFSNTSAQKAGIQVGDIVVLIDNENVYNSDDITKVLLRHSVGDTIPISIARKEARLDVNVLLYPAPSNAAIIQETQTGVDAQQPWAYELLGGRYLSGNGVEQNYDKALALFHKGIAVGDPYCASLAAFMYSEGTGVPRNVEKAKSLLERPVQQEIGHAERVLGEVYQFGYGKPEDRKEAMRLYQMAAEKHEASAMMHLGRMYADGDPIPRDDRMAVEWYRKGADRGDEECLYQLGWMYANGHGVTADQSKAFELYRSASEKKHGQATYQLGLAYLNGAGTARNCPEALKCFEAVSSAGDANGHIQLGGMYATGACVSQDDAIALKHYRAAANAGSAVGQYAVAQMYFHGRGVAEDRKEAVKWYLKAAEGGYPQSLGVLGVCALNGYGMPKSVAQARDYFTKGGEAGDSLSQANLGVMILEGNGFQKDVRKAIGWLKRAAEQEMTDAQWKLGEVYLTGAGTPVNREEGIKWLKKAADKGQKQAQELLDKHGVK